MILFAGERLGPNDMIVSSVGAGGTEEVRDTRLRHEVAVEIFPEKVAGSRSGSYVRA